MNVDILGKHNFVTQKSMNGSQYSFELCRKVERVNVISRQMI